MVAAVAAGTVLEYAANIIAENIYSQVDDEGKQQVLIEDIVDHKSDATAVPKSQTPGSM